MPAGFELTALPACISTIRPVPFPFVQLTVIDVVVLAEKVTADACVVGCAARVQSPYVAEEVVR